MVGVSADGRCDLKIVGWVVSGLTCLGFVDALCAQSNPVLSLEVDTDEIIDQRPISKVACGPVAIANVLKFGPKYYRGIFEEIEGSSGKDKVTTIVNRHGYKTSEDRGAGHRFRPGKGVTAFDLRCMLNELLPRRGVRGESLHIPDRVRAEAHLRNVHGAIREAVRGGIPLILSLRSYEVTDPKEDSTGPRWKLLGHHYVVLTSVPEKLANHAKGFAFDYLDPWGGKLAQGYVRIEKHRPFTALKGSNQNNVWLRNSRFLLATVPSTPIHTQSKKWSQRTIITLDYLIGEFSELGG